MKQQNSTKIVLITSFNGFLASNIAMKVLEAGYILRGTVRARERVAPLLEGIWKDHLDRIQIHEIPDIMDPHAFDEAVKGVTSIIHLSFPAPIASPTPPPASHLITSNVTSTRNILHSAHQHAGPQLESFILTSSVSACINPEHVAPLTYTDDSWNVVHPRMLKEIGGDESAADPYITFPISRIRAEEFMQEFREEFQPHFTLTTLCPSIPTGPPIYIPPTASLLPLSIRPIYAVLMGITEPSPADHAVRIAGAAPYVDIRNLTDIYLWCVESPEKCDGERYLVVAGHGPKRAMVDVLWDAYPERRGVMEGLKGNGEGGGYRRDWKFDEGGVGFDCRKVKEAAGLEWIPFDRSILDTAKALEPLLDL